MADDTSLTISFGAETGDLVDGVEQAKQAIAGIDGAVGEAAGTFGDLKKAADIGASVAKYTNDAGAMAKAAERAAKQAQQAWVQSFKPIEHAMGQAVTGMILHGENWHKAVARIGQSVVQTMVNNVVKRIVDNWIAGELAKTMATLTGEETRVAAQTAGAAEGAAAQGAANKKSIIGDAFTAAGNVYNSVSAIPYVGWIMAPIAAAAAFAAVMAFSSGIPSFDVGAWEIPSSGLAMVHQGETIIPAGQAEAFRQGAGGGGMSVSLNISALDGASVQAWANRNAKTLAKTLASHMQMNPSTRPAY